MLNEQEKKAVHELLNSVNVVRSKTEELIQLQTEQKMLYLLSSGCDGCFRSGTMIWN